MREDLLCFSRVLNLVAHYEAGLDYNLDILIKSTKYIIMNNKSAIVVGAGILGLATARSLAEKGYAVTVIERSQFSAF